MIRVVDVHVTPVRELKSGEEIRQFPVYPVPFDTADPSGIVSSFSAQ